MGEEIITPDYRENSEENPDALQQNLNSLKDISNLSYYMKPIHDSALNTLDKEYVINKSLSDKLKNKLAPDLSEDLRELYDDTYFDKLTGCLNRNGGYPLLKEAISKYDHVSVASFDLDHFRKMNDQKGREFGDEVIRFVGRELLHFSLNSGLDICPVRMGGEEFMIFGGDVSQNVLMDRMNEISEKLKNHVREKLLTKEDIDIIGDEVFKNKYKADKDGRIKAKDEIGGITSAVIELKTHGIKVKKETELIDLKNNPKIVSNIIQFVDSIMEKQKNNKGRGKVYGTDLEENGEIVNLTPDFVGERVYELVPHNMCDQKQNQIIEDMVDIYNKKVYEVFNYLLSKYKWICEESSYNNKQKDELFELLRSPNYKQQLIEDFGIPIRDFLDLKKEFLEAKQKIFHYTGAANIEYLKKELSKKESYYTNDNCYKIEIKEFKSANEVMGHTGGDLFLTYFCQEIIHGSINSYNNEIKKKDSKLKKIDGDYNVIVSQKGADFYIVFSNNISKEEQKKYFEVFYKNYKSKLEELTTSIGESDISNISLSNNDKRFPRKKIKYGDLLQKRVMWLIDNKEEWSKLKNLEENINNLFIPIVKKVENI